MNLNEILSGELSIRYVLVMHRWISGSNLWTAASIKAVLGTVGRDLASSNVCEEAGLGFVIIISRTLPSIFVIRT